MSTTARILLIGTVCVTLAWPSDAQDHAPALLRPRFRAEQVLVRTIPGLAGQGGLVALEQLVQGDLLHAYHLVPDLYLLSTRLDVRKAVADLGSDSRVVYAHPNWLFVPAGEPNDPSFDKQWGLHTEGDSLTLIDGTVVTPLDDNDVDAPEAWSIHVGTGSTVIAILDTGIETEHPDLVDRLWTDDDGNVGKDYVSEGGMTDTSGHGTFVAGIIGAAGNDEVGITGVLQDCRLMPLRFLASTTSGVSGDMASAIAALEFAVDEGVRLSNNSYGALFDEDDDLSAMFDAIEDAAAADHLFVCAAGNDGVDLDDEDVLYYPAEFGLDNMLVVTSIDTDGERPDNASYGPGVVDIAAPGQHIFSTADEDAYGYDSGTSYATAFVTGVAGLVWDQNPDWTYAQVKERLMDTARTVDGLEEDCACGGVVNAGSAIVFEWDPPDIDWFLEVIPDWVLERIRTLIGPFLG